MKEIIHSRIVWQEEPGPTPWIVEERQEEKYHMEPYFIRDASRNIVCTIARGMYCTKESALKTAQLIVDAVNSYKK